MQVYLETSIMEALIANTEDIICALNPAGEFVYIASGVKAKLGYQPEEISGKSFSEFVPEFEWDNTRQRLQAVTNGGKVTPFSNRVYHRSGKLVIINWSFTWLAELELIIGIGREIVQQDEPVLHQEVILPLYQALVDFGTDMIGILNQDAVYMYVGGSQLALSDLGYVQEDLVGKQVFDFIHPEDVSRLQQTFDKILNTYAPLSIPEFRFKTRDGDWRWIEVTVINQFHNPLINGVVATSKDVTQRVNGRLQLQESEQRFKSLFENNPSMVVLENKEGLVLDVNPAVLRSFGYAKEEVMHKPLINILPPETHSICLESLQSAFAGEEVHLELVVPEPNGEQRILEVFKVPVIMEEEIVAVYTIANDITASTSYLKTIKKQARKLNTIFESITDAFFTLDPNWNFTYINPEFDRILGTDRHELIGKNIMQFFPEKDHPVFYKNYRHALETGESVHFEGLTSKRSLWLDIKVFPSEEGLSIYFSDVTEKVKSRQELEKLSLVASKTINGVIFLDADLKVEWANEAFVKLTGFTLEEMIGKRPASLLQGPETDPVTAARLLNNSQLRTPFKEEILNYRKDGTRIWFSLEFTPIIDPQGKVTRTIVMQTDITYRKEAEAAQQKLTQDLYRQNRDMQQFTYIVSHNLRAPVANAMGYVQLLQEADKNTDTYNQFLINLKTSIFRLDAILKDLNLILSIRDNENNYGLEPVDVLVKCRQAIGNIQESLERCRGEITVDIPEGTRIIGNRIYLHSIFYNLLSNAVKYRSPDRRLKIHVKSQPVASGGTLITISDNGSGFNYEQAGNQVFKMYKRFHNNVEGRGLGLFLVKTHLEAMGGHIEVSSQVNAGTRFSIFFK